jgi:hypothetical protein
MVKSASKLPWAHAGNQSTGANFRIDQESFNSSNNLRPGIKFSSWDDPFTVAMTQDIRKTKWTI